MDKKSKDLIHRSNLISENYKEIIDRQINNCNELFKIDSDFELFHEDVNSNINFIEDTIESLENISQQNNNELIRNTEVIKKIENGFFKLLNFNKELINQFQSLDLLKNDLSVLRNNQNKIIFSKIDLIN